jgi:hypothetical protein
MVGCADRRGRADGLLRSGSTFDLFWFIMARRATGKPGDSHAESRMIALFAE